MFHVVAVRNVSNVIQWRMRRDLLHDDLQRPLADLKMSLRLSRDLRPQGGSGCQHSAVLLEQEICQKLTPAILTAAPITVQDCDRLLALLIDHEQHGIDALREGICADYLEARQALHELQHRPPPEPEAARRLLGEILASHAPRDAQGFRLCKHGSAYGTVSASFLFRDADGRTWMEHAPGPPCRTAFRRYDLP